jgi:hypothetical protein
MRFENYLNEVKNMEKTMIGFGVDNNYFISLASKIKEILDKKGLSYEEVKEKHVTIAQIPGKYPKDNLIRDINKIKTNVTFKPKSLGIFKGIMVDNDFIVVEYSSSDKYKAIFNYIASKYNVRMFPGGIRIHISLFKIPRNSMEVSELESIKKLPKIQASSVELFNNKFSIEYKKEK